MKRLLAYLGVAVLVGCYKTPAPAPSSPAASNTTAQSSHVRDYRATIADPVGFLPIDSEIVLAMDLDQVRRSQLWDPIVEQLKTRTQDKLASLTAECGFDPIAAVRGATIGMKTYKQGDPTGVVVMTGVPRDKVTACLDSLPPTDATQSSLHKDHGVYIIRSSSNAIALTFVDDSTMVLLLDPKADRAAMERILSAGSPLRRSPTFTQLIAQVDTSSAVWAIMNGRASVFDLSTNTSQRPTAVWGSLHLEDGAALSMRLRFVDPSIAQQLATQIQSQISTLQAFFDRLDVNADGAELSIEAAMSETKVSGMLALFSIAPRTPAPPPTSVGPTPVSP